VGANLFGTSRAAIDVAAMVESTATPTAAPKADQTPVVASLFSSTPAADASGVSSAADTATDAAVAAELAAFAPAPASGAVAAASTAEGYVHVGPGGAIGGAGASGPVAAAASSMQPRLGTEPLDAELAAVRQSPMRGMLAALLASKRNLAIAGGAVVLLVIVLAVAMSGGDKSKPETVASTAAEKKPTKVEEPAKPVDEPSTPEDEPAAAKVATGGTNREPSEEPAAGSDAAAEGSAEGSDAAAEGSGAGSAAPAKVAVAKPSTGAVKPGAASSKKTLGGKQVVLEYDAQATTTAKPAATAAKNDQAAVLKARQSYAQGNQKLLAGDWNGAIMKYRQSLANYPGYVAGYRGLGLAFMQKGDKPKALQAFRLYISSVPGAKDAPLIKKRIAQLQK
jgi:hypothetical protein